MADTQESTALVALNLNLPAPAFVAEQVNKAYSTIYTKIEEEIAAFVPDVTTEKGRKAIASLAYKIARTKTALDEAAKGVTADQKAIIDAVNAERSKAWDDIEALQAKARKPLTDWENAEKERLARVRDLSMTLNNIEIMLVGHSSEELKVIFGDFNSTYIGEDMHGEDAVRLSEMLTSALETINHEIANAERREAEAAELEQLRREKAEREAAAAAQKAEEERKAAEAAEIARREEERARIAREAEEKAKRDAAEAIQRAEDEKAEAQRNAEQMKKSIAEQQEASRRWKAEQEEQRKEAAARAEEQAKQREEAAKAAERQRIADEAERQRVADQERAADLAHRKRLNGEALAALVKVAGLSEKDAQAVIIAIYKEQVPHVAILY